MIWLAAGLAVMLAGMLADAVITLYGIKVGLREVNPVMRWLFSVMSPLWALVLTRGALLGLVVAVAVYFPDGPWAALSAALIGVIHGLVAFLNERKL